MTDEALMDIVKIYLHKTWDLSEDEAALLSLYIQNGKRRLEKIAGVPLDFSEGLPQALLLDYCRYADAQALEVFEKNFAGELLSLSLEAGGEEDANQTTD